MHLFTLWELFFLLKQCQMTLTNHHPQFDVACRVSWLGDESMWCRDMLVFHKKGWREMEAWSSWARSDGWGYRVATVSPNPPYFPASQV